MSNMDDYIKEQEENRKKARENFNDLLDCFLKADSQYRNLIGMDAWTLLNIKAQGNQEINEMLTQWIHFQEFVSKIMNGH